MSGKILGWAMETKTGNPTTKLVLAKLADNSNEEGYCWPSIGLIVDHTELSLRSVRDHLGKLEALGLIEIERRQEDGVHLQNRFFLMAPWTKRFKEREARLAAEKGAGGSAGGAVPMQMVQEGDAAGAGGSAAPAGGVVQEIPRHIEEPPIEPSQEPSQEPEASPPGPGDLFGLGSSKPRTPAEELDAAYAAYDAAAERNGWGRVAKRTSARDAGLKRRLKDAGGLKGWLAALEKAEASDFCMGRAPPRDGQGPFKLDLDFLVSETKFTRLMEGKYDNHGTRGQRPGGGGGYLAAAARRATDQASFDPG